MGTEAIVIVLAIVTLVMAASHVRDGIRIKKLELKAFDLEDKAIDQKSTLRSVSYRVDMIGHSVAGDDYHPLNDTGKFPVSYVAGGLKARVFDLESKAIKGVRMTITDILAGKIPPPGRVWFDNETGDLIHQPEHLQHHGWITSSVVYGHDRDGSPRQCKSDKMVALATIKNEQPEIENERSDEQWQFGDPLRLGGYWDVVYLSGSGNNCKVAHKDGVVTTCKKSDLVKRKK